MVQELPHVRIAQPSDEEALMDMIREIHKTNGVFVMDDDKVRECLHKCYYQKGTIVGVIGSTGRLEASICMAIGEAYYSRDWHLAEYWNYVVPAYRRSKNAEALIKFAKDCSDKMGIPLLIGVTTTSNMSAKVRLYQRLLGKPYGAFFIHNPPKAWARETIEDHRDLRFRLRQAADRCASRSKEMSFSKVKKELGPLLREAAEALSEDEPFTVPAQASEAA